MPERKTVGQLMEEMRLKAGAQNYHGHEYMDLERFAEDTRHMIIFDKDAPFIILDEPTAALDPIAEAEIYSKFDEIAGNKTAIYISHRLSSCKFCDEIAVFHEGAVIQQGSHAELLADRGGKYYALWNAQAQYYTE